MHKFDISLAISMTIVTESLLCICIILKVDQWPFSQGMEMSGFECGQDCLLKYLVDLDPHIFFFKFTATEINYAWFLDCAHILTSC